MALNSEIEKFINNKKIVDATKLSLNDWLKLFDSPERDELLFIDWSFPTDSMREEYIKSIGARSDEEVINLLRNFLIPSGSFYADKHVLDYLEFCRKTDTEQFSKLMKSERHKRLVKSCFDHSIPAWDGNTWVIDLLPDHPKLALDAVYSYFIAHIQDLPDGRWDGLSDVRALIRAKFINAPHSKPPFLELSPYEFEHLVNTLYHEMGYNTRLTPMTHDGGRDIIAEKQDIGSREKLLIQCKRTKKIKELKKSERY